MTVKLFIFMFMLYLIGMFLGSSYEYQNTAEAAGVAYTTGTATFTNDSTTVTGSGTSWDNSTMAGGIIKLDADDVWCKISSVSNTTLLTLTDAYTGTGGSGDYTMAVSSAWAGNEQSERLSTILNYESGKQSLPVLGVIPMPVPVAYFFDNWQQILLLDFEFLHQPGYQMVQWFLYGFAIAGILSFVLLFMGLIRGNVTWG